MRVEYPPIFIPVGCQEMPMFALHPSSMQVFYYGNTGFGTEDLLCMLLIGCMLLLKNGPDRSMLIEGLC